MAVDPLTTWSRRIIIPLKKETADTARRQNGLSEVLIEVLESIAGRRQARANGDRFA